jgi:subtilisin-like proprotein convertase family protein
MKIVYNLSFVFVYLGITYCCFSSFNENTNTIKPSSTTRRVTSTTTITLRSISKERSPLKEIKDLSSINDSITVTETGTVVFVELHISISHTCISDLGIKLISPDQTEIILELPFVDNCIEDLEKSYPPSAYDSFDLLNGKRINGTWILNVSDDYNGDEGVLNFWRLNIDYI